MAVRSANSPADLGLTNPGILPGHRDTLIVAAEAHVGPVAVAELHGLVLAQRKRKGPSDARACLPSDGIGNAVQAGGTTKPEISVQRGPQLRVLADVVTQVTLKRADGALGLRSWIR